MKILIVSKCQTHPVDAGNRKFIFNQVELFEGLGHEVHFLWIFEQATMDFDKSDSPFESMKKYWGERLHIYRVSKFFHIYTQILHRLRLYFNKGFNKVDDCYDNGIHKFINKLQSIHNFNACVINYYYLSKVAEKVNIPLIGLTTHDYFSYKSLLVGDKKVALNTTAHQEAIALQRCKHIFALNSEEAVFFQRLSPLSRVYNVYCNYTFYKTQVVGNHNILFFSGSNQYNINGLTWFLETVFPSIIETFPDVRLVIGGSISKYIDTSKYSNIEIYGFVDDLDDFFCKGDVVINPTYQGTGLKIKTFEGVSFDKVTMVHPHSMIGIYKPETAPIFASEKAVDWVTYLSSMWSDKRAINDVKERNKIYLNEMNNYIKEEYIRFLSQNK